MINVCNVSHFSLAVAPWVPCRGWHRQVSLCASTDERLWRASQASVLGDTQGSEISKCVCYLGILQHVNVFFFSLYGNLWQLVSFIFFLWWTHWWNQRNLSGSSSYLRLGSLRGCLCIGVFALDRFPRHIWRTIAGRTAIETVCKIPWVVCGEPSLDGWLINYICF